MTPSILPRAAAVAVLLLLAAPGRGGARTPADLMLVAADLSSMITLDPAAVSESLTSGILRNVCDTLVALDDEDASRVVPGVAESWSVSEDGRTFTFRLREGLAFPSGNPVTARDFAWSMQRNLELNLASAKRLREWGINRDNVAQVVSVVDERTLQITPPRAYAPSLFLFALTDYRVAPALDSVLVQQHAIGGDRGNRWLSRNTACYGPFGVKTWRPQEVLVMERNPGWRKENGVRKVLMRHIPEPGSQRLMLQRGDIDLAVNIDPADYDALESDPNTYLMRTPGLRVIYMAFNTQDPRFQDTRVIQAFRHLIDYDTLAQTVLRNAAEVRQSPVPSGMFGALPRDFRPYTFNPDRARQLLHDAGVEDLEVELMTQSSYPYFDIAQHIQANAAQIGVRVNIAATIGKHLYSSLRARKFVISLSGYAFNYPDANTVMLRHAYNPRGADKDNSVSLAWRTSWVPPDWFNEQILEAQTEADPTRRQQLYQDLQRYHVENSPLIYLFQRINVRALNRAVKVLKCNAVSSCFCSLQKED
jgi:peptide/nickel transport system substrate-binding protein